MAFADPQSVTISAVAKSLPRVSSGANSGSFQKDDAEVVLDFSHSLGKRNRRLVKLTHTKTAADPFVTGLNVLYKMGVHIVVDVPPVGYTIAEQKAVIDGFLAWATASSGAKITQFLGGES